MTSRKLFALDVVARIGGIALALCVMLPAASASAQQVSTTAQGAIGGGLLGAGTGAIVGAAVHHPVKGALIGAGVGAVGGGLIGNQLQQREAAQHQLQAEVNAQQHQIDRQRQEIQELKQESSSTSNTSTNSNSPSTMETE
jgi:uncharacterized protein YcfJ